MDTIFDVFNFFLEYLFLKIIIKFKKKFLS